MNLLLLLLEPVSVTAETVVETSPWTPTMITALFAAGAAAFVSIIVALGKVLVDLKSAKGAAVVAVQTAEVAVTTAAEMRQVVEHSRVQGEKAGAARDQKLDEIKMLVDGRFSQVLDKVATLTRAIADSSNLPEDIKAAEDAEEAAVKQKDKVLAMGVVVEGVLTVTPGVDQGPNVVKLEPKVKEPPPLS